MAVNYEHLSAEERGFIMSMTEAGSSARAIARALRRSPSTISRELRRPTGMACDVGPAECAPAFYAYDARAAASAACRLRRKPRRVCKLALDSVLFDVVRHFLQAGWSPQQIAGTLAHCHPHKPELRVSHETIYTCIYAQAKGELRRALIACLRKAHAKRVPRTRGADRRGQLPEMVSIHLRPPEASDRQMPGHWEGDLIKGAGNRSSVGVLVERTSRLVLLAKMDSASAEAALAAFTAKLQTIAPAMRQSLTYDQGREMARHRQLSQATGVRVYFCDPHSPWQRGTCENTNGLLRQYLPKSTDLSVHSQADLDAIADRLNSRPRKMHGYFPPLAVYQAMLDKLSQPAASIQ